MRAAVLVLAVLLPSTLPLEPGGLARQANTAAPRPAGPVTVPIQLDHNRVVVDLQARRQDGSMRPVRAWLDLWGSEVLLTGTLARDLGLTMPDTEAKTVEVALPLPVHLVELACDVGGLKGRVPTGSRWLVPGLGVEMKLPLTAFHRYQVVLDYPARQLTLAVPGAIPHRGARIPAAINPKNGMIQIDARIDGEAHGFVLDGAPYSAVSDTLVNELASRHPDWPRRTGALGAANVWGMGGEDTWPMLRVPTLQVGTVSVTGLGLVGPPGFIGYYSSQALRPVSGLLGGNFLSGLRIDFDLAAPALYIESAHPDRGGDLDLVGLTLQPQSDGTYAVLAVAIRDGQAVVERAEPGDKLVLVDGVDVTGADMGAVIDRLRGTPGQVHTLVFDRKGQRFSVMARVERFM